MKRRSTVDGEVGPSQGLEFRGEFLKKEALFGLKMAFLGSKSPW
jgi:hypothetical protein